MQKGVEARFRARIAEPLHEPLPQLIVMNKILADIDDFVHSPRSTVTVLYGEEYPDADYGDPDAIRRVDCNHLIENGEYVDKVPLHVVDKPGRYLPAALRPLVWRVSPAGPRVLHVSGLGTEEAWSLNRTRATLALRDRGFDSLADGYTAFYLSA